MRKRTVVISGLILAIGLAGSSIWLSPRNAPADDTAGKYQPSSTKRVERFGDRVEAFRKKERPPEASDQPTEAELFALFGMPDRFINPAPNSTVTFEMMWERATVIRAVFQDGKAAELAARFSADVPSDVVTLANFKKLALGATEKEITAVLGERTATATRKDGSTTVVWGRALRLRVVNSRGKYLRVMSYQDPCFPVLEAELNR